jgi:hypothetical protein
MPSGSRSLGVPTRNRDSFARLRLIGAAAEAAPGTDAGWSVLPATSQEAIMLPPVLRPAAAIRVRRPSPALTISLVALFLALGGTVSASTSKSSHPVIGVSDTQTQKEVHIPAHQAVLFQINCPGKDEFAINGAFSTNSQTPITESAATHEFRKWQFGFVNQSGEEQTVSAGIDCLKLKH